MIVSNISVWLLVSVWLLTDFIQVFSAQIMPGVFESYLFGTRRISLISLFCSMKVEHIRRLEKKKKDNVPVKNSNPIIKQNKLILKTKKHLRVNLLSFVPRKFPLLA